MNACVHTPGVTSHGKTTSNCISDFNFLHLLRGAVADEGEIASKEAISAGPAGSS